MPRLVIQTGEQQGRFFHLQPGTNRIGRSPRNDFQIDDSSVSANHCEVTRSETVILVRDLNSTNGTWADQASVHSDWPVPLQSVLQIGHINLHLQRDENGADAPLVRVPQLPVELAPTSGQLPDGTPACINHPEGSALYQCTQCQQTLCESCVRKVGRRGGITLVFCSLCSASCQLLPPSRTPRRQRRLLDWLTRTLKLPFRK